MLNASAAHNTLKKISDALALKSNTADVYTQSVTNSTFAKIADYYDKAYLNNTAVAWSSGTTSTTHYLDTGPHGLYIRTGTAGITDEALWIDGSASSSTKGNVTIRKKTLCKR